MNTDKKNRSIYTLLDDFAVFTDTFVGDIQINPGR